MDKTRAVIFLNGTFASTGASTYIPDANDLVIAVDGGIRHPRLLGVTPDILIGDLDSIDPEDLEWCQSQQVEIRKYPKEKDETDFELALDHAIVSVAGAVTVFGALGGRIDHALANIGLLSDPRYAGREINIIADRETMFFIHRKAVITGKEGQTLSLIPWGEQVTGVTTTGMQYPLKNETLYPYRSRGISNVVVSGSAIIEFKEGKLLCVINQCN